MAYIILQPIAIIVGFISFVFACAFRAIHKREVSQKSNLQATNATVEQIYNHNDNSLEYHVSFDHDGTRVTAKAGRYCPKQEAKVCAGETVEIGYYFLRNGTPRAIIFDNRLIPVSEIIPRCCKVMAAIWIICLCLACSWYAIAWIQFLF